VTVADAIKQDAELDDDARELLLAAYRGIRAHCRRRRESP
jgi:hypothetical protein